MQLIEAAIFYFGKESKAKIYVAGKLLENTHLNFGYNTVNLGLPPVSKPTLIELKVVAGDFSMKNSITLDPENAKFRWRCEASWPVDKYLKCRPASQIERYRNGNSAFRISDRQFASFHNCQRSDKAME